jgi:septum formation protein
MNDDEIHAYIATGECSDKAGAYAIQGYGGRYIEGIEGDYYAVMGLPLHLVYAELKRRQII